MDVVQREQLRHLGLLIRGSQQEKGSQIVLDEKRSQPAEGCVEPHDLRCNLPSGRPFLYALATSSSRSAEILGVELTSRHHEHDELRQVIPEVLVFLDRFLCLLYGYSSQVNQTELDPVRYIPGDAPWVGTNWVSRTQSPPDMILPDPR